MKVYTKEWYYTFELKRVWWWFRKEGGTRLMPVFDDTIPELPDEIRVDGTSYFPGASRAERTIRVVPVTSMIPLYEDYSVDVPEAPMQSLEKDVRCTLINRMRIMEKLPNEILKSIPDKRLFAMGYAPPEVRQKVFDYCNSLPEYKSDGASTEKETDRIMQLLTLSRQIETEDLNPLPMFFEDDPVRNFIQTNNSLKIQLMSGDSLVLTEAKIIEIKGELHGGTVRELELHEVDERYELHLLLYRYDENLMQELFYASFSFKDMYYE